MTAALGNPFALGATGIQTTARYDRLTLGASFRPGTAALAAVSGVLVGPAGTMGDLTLLTDTLLRTDPFLAVVQGTHNTQQGQYVVPNVVQRDLAVPVKDASLFRKALVRVRVADSLEAGVASSASTDGAWLEVVSGDLAASNPVLPALGPNAVALGELSIPSSGSGQPVTLTKYNPRTGSRTGILPVVDTDAVAGAFLGQYRDHPTRGLQRWDGTGWETATGKIGKRLYAGTQSIGTGWTLFSAWAEIAGYDNASGVGMWSSGAPSRLVAPIAGRYRAIGAITNCTHMQVRKNSAGSSTVGTMEAASTGGVSASYNAIADELQMAAGDYLEVFALNSGGAVTAGAQFGYVAQFALSYIGPL